MKMLTVVLAILTKLVVILKEGLRNISKKITSLIFLSRYTPPQHALTRIILSFKIIDKANSKFDLKIKEALHINWRKPSLNAQQNHLALTLSPKLPLVLFCLCFFFFFAFLFHLSFSLYSTLIIDIFSCLNYTLLLLHLITTHLKSHLALSSIIFIISALIIGIFYCLNDTHRERLMIHSIQYMNGSLTASDLFDMISQSINCNISIYTCNIVVDIYNFS